MAAIDWESVIKAVTPIVAAIITAGGIGGIYLKYYLSQNMKKEERRRNPYFLVAHAESEMQKAIGRYTSKIHPDQFGDEDHWDNIAKDIANICLPPLQEVSEGYIDVVYKNERQLLVQCIDKARDILGTIDCIKDNGDKAMALSQDVRRLRDLMIGKM